jgi:hypothetical protein
MLRVTPFSRRFSLVLETLPRDVPQPTHNARDRSSMGPYRVGEYLLHPSPTREQINFWKSSLKTGLGA